MKKILIVEDDPYVQRFYKALFERNQYEVEFAGDGQEGIEKAESIMPDLILLDIMMPKVNGLVALKAIKNNPKTKHLQVIILSNFGEEKNVKEAMLLGANAFLLKVAYSPQKLLAQVEKYINSKNAPE